MERKIVRIDKEKCNGCGSCIPNCHEGAIQVIDGKATLVKDALCDGLGACLGHCPKGAITIETRQAEAFDENEVKERALQKEGRTFLGCPGSRAMDLDSAKRRPQGAVGQTAVSELGQWPIQLHLINPHAPYFKDADLVVAADCVPFAYAGFHGKFLKGKKLVILCPKLDNGQDSYMEKLTALFKDNSIRSISIVHMEVPCCFGTVRLVEEALKRSGKNIILKEYTVSLQGEIV